MYIYAEKVYSKNCTIHVAYNRRAILYLYYTHRTNKYKSIKIIEYISLKMRCEKSIVNRQIFGTGSYLKCHVALVKRQTAASVQTRMVQVQSRITQAVWIITYHMLALQAIVLFLSGFFFFLLILVCFYAFTLCPIAHLLRIVSFSCG